MVCKLVTGTLEVCDTKVLSAVEAIAGHNLSHGSARMQMIKIEQSIQAPMG